MVFFVRHERPCIEQRWPYKDRHMRERERERERRREMGFEYLNMLVADCVM